MEGFVIDRNSLLRGNLAEVPDHVGNADAVEIVRLAAGQDRGQDLVLLGGGEDEDRVCRRLLQRLEEGVEGRLGQHMDLVDDIDAVLAHLRRHLHFLDQGLDIVHAVVGRGVQQRRGRYQGPMSGPGWAQLIIFAKMRAVVVFPTPRGPQKR